MNRADVEQQIYEMWDAVWSSCVDDDDKEIMLSQARDTEQKLRSRLDLEEKLINVTDKLGSEELEKLISYIKANYNL